MFRRFVAGIPGGRSTMRVYWMLRGGESAEIYDGAEIEDAKPVVYRVGVERLVEAEVKIVRQDAGAKIINSDSRLKVIDIAVAGALFLEVSGERGVAFGWYEAVVAP
jgi:hypothetical protein